MGVEIFIVVELIAVKPIKEWRCGDQADYKLYG